MDQTMNLQLPLIGFKHSLRAETTAASFSKKHCAKGEEGLMTIALAVFPWQLSSSLSRSDAEA
jgi:hypothetical protein